MRRCLSILGAALWSLLLCGCFEVKDELTIRPDGSGVVRIETRTLVPAEALESTGMPFDAFGAEGAAVYPPNTPEEARRFFPAAGFRIEVQQRSTGSTGAVFSVVANFTNIQALLDSPYAAAHALELRIEGGQLRLSARNAIEPVARFGETTVQPGPFGAPGAGIPDDVRRKTNELRAEFRVTLPGTAQSTNGVAEGSTVSWVTERRKTANTAAFHEELGRRREAVWPADAVQFRPISPPRLGLASFAELVPGPSAGATNDTPSVERVQAAARFVPCAMHVTRSLDLSGEGSMQPSRAQFVGALLLPSALTPSRWGPATVVDATDAQGKSLRFESEDEEQDPMRYVRETMDDEEGENGAGGKEATAGEVRHLVTLAFQAPDWQAKEIARLEGKVRLQYFGAGEVVKLTNAIPASAIREMKADSSDFGMDGSDRGIEDPALSRLGLPLKLGMVMAQSGSLMMMFQTEAQAASVTQAQVFDAEGRPWPTVFAGQGMMGESMFQAMVPGRPAPPLSLALLVRGGGSQVDVPIVVEHVPIRSTSK